MTGLSVYGNYIYLGSRNQNRTYRYALPNITGMVSFTYMMGATNSCDIAFNGSDNLVWVACESETIAVRCYDDANTMVDYLDISLVPNARGLTLDPEGYLWVSDVDADKIYKVDLTEGVEGSESGEVSLSVVPSANPFSGAVTLQADGLEATVTVFDMHGRQVEADSFQESWTWNSSAPAGSYVFVVNDGNGNVESLNLVKI